MTRWSAALSLKVSSTWSARMKIVLMRAIWNCGVAKSQSRARFVSSVDCIVIAVPALAEPAVPLLA